MKKQRSRRAKVDPITLEVARTRLEAIVEEMGATVLRTFRGEEVTYLDPPA